MSFSGIEAFFPRAATRPEMRCEYCRRPALTAVSNCEGCGAPLPPPGEFVEVTTLGDKDRRYERVR